MLATDSTPAPSPARVSVPRYFAEATEVNYGPGGLGLFGTRFKREIIFAKAPYTGIYTYTYLLAVVDSPAWGCAGQGRFDAQFRADINTPPHQRGHMTVTFIPYDGPRQIRHIVLCADGSWRDMQTLLHVNLYGELFTIG
jgi:hypothetical protein